MKKVLFSFATLALAVASAASNTFHMNLAEPASVGGTVLKPGDYKVQVEGDKAIFKMGKTVVEASAKMETGERKYESTQVQIENSGNKPRITEIRFGGTNTRLVVQKGSGTAE